MTVAQAIEAALAQARPIVADAFHADAYQIQRATRTTNDRGQPVETPAVVESGLCALSIQPIQAPERLSAGGTVTVGVVSYQAEMPEDTVLKDTDTLLVNGRTFRVIAVRTGGLLDLFPVADLQAWDEDN